MTALFTQKGQLRKQYEKVCLDTDVWDNYPTLEAYAAEHEVSFDSVQYDQWLKKTEAAVIKQLRYYAFLIYRMMLLTDDWGDAGRAQIEGSFSRFLLGVPPEDTMSYQHSHRFIEKIESETEAFGFDQWTLEAIKSSFDALSITLLGKDFDIHEFVPLNKCLQFLGSDIFVQGGVYGLAKEFMAGHGYQEIHGDYTCVTLEEEVLRSPNTIIAMAAVIGDKDVFIRMESLRTIFYLKWVATVQSWSYGGLYWDEERRLSEGIKRACVSRYCDMTKIGLETAKDTFVKDLRETVMYHELGHGVIQHHLLPVEAGAMGETSKVIGENGVTALLEFLADFAPAHAGIKGPLQNMVDVAQSDPERAEKMFWMYVSDTWFFDTDDRYMFLYSDLMALCFITVVKPDHSIDWELLQSLIQSGDDDRPCMVDFSIDWVVAATQEWKALAASATYELTDNPSASFTTLLETIHTSLKTEWTGPEPFDVDSYPVTAATWAQVFESLHQRSDKADDYHALIEQQDKNLLSQFFAQILTPDQHATYRDNLHGYVMDQFQKKGVYWSKESAESSVY